jgi:glycolate oxidase FAD binding subunit
VVTVAAATRPASDADAVDGVRPELVAEPASAAEAAELLRDTAGRRVLVRGGGSKLGLGNPPEGAELLLSTAGLGRVLEHAAGDLVVRVEAGVRLADLQRELAPAGQQLALDPPQPGATVGGVVAANASGPRRLRYGTVRDLIIGITVVLADGTVAHAGGKVVKNVAGYDLAKLFCGSLGTLGLIAEAIFRLHPLPEAAGAVTLPLERPEQLGEAIQRLLRSTLVPSAIELSWADPEEPGALTVVLEGIRPGVEAQVAEAARLLGGGASGTVLAPGERLAGLGELPWKEGEVGVKAACPPADLPGALTDLWTAAAASGLVPRVTGHAGTGVLHVGLPLEGVEPLAGFVDEARERLAARGGSLVVAEAPVELKRAVDVWGPPGDAIGLMHRVKQRFDPDRRMSPGRFLGGI